MGVTSIELKPEVYSEREATFQSIRESIQRGEAIRFVLVELSDEDESLINHTLETVLDQYQRSDLLAMLYTCVKELVVNAVKANAKDMWFRMRGYDINDERDYLRGTEEYAGEFSEAQIHELAPKLREAGMLVELELHHTNEGIRLHVSNTTLISPHDEARMRHKMQVAAQYDDLLTFWTEQGSDTEGAGMGLALVVLLLKGEGLDPNLFRIGIRDRRTSARLEIPLSESYQSIR